MREWSADVTVDEDLARRLVAGQFPELADAPFRAFAEGWDNAIWLVDERWVFRIPRRAIAIPGVKRELAVLPRLAGRLPVAVPEPVFVGRPDAGYPWPFFGGPLIEGEEAADAELADDDRRALAPAIAAFVRELHEIDIDGLPADPNGRSDMHRRVPLTAGRLDEVSRLDLWRPPDAARRLLDEARRLPPPDGDVLLHGDLNLRNLIVHDGKLAGVIDWGDVCRGDPAIDLSLYWSLFPPDSRAAFREAYGPISAAQLVRSRVLALHLCATLALYAHHDGMPSVQKEAIDGLERTVSDA